MEWVSNLNASGSLTARSVQADVNGNVYVAGYYGGTAKIFNGVDSTVLPAANGNNAFLLKFNPSGHLTWAKTIVPTSPDYAYDESHAVTVDASGNVYWGGMVGSFTATVAGASQTFTSMGSNTLDIMVAKLTPSGDYTWIKTFGSTGKEQVYALVLDVSGNIFLTGSTAAAVDFDPGVAGGEVAKVGSNDLFVLSLNNSGAFRWVTSGGLAAKTYVGRGLAADPSGNIYVTGEYSGAGVIGGVTVPTAAGVSPIVFKLTNAGAVTWVAPYPGNFEARGHGVAVDKAGNVYSVGMIKGVYDFDPSSATKNLTSNTTSSFDGYVAKLNSSGGYVFSFLVSSTAGAGYDECKAIWTDKDDNLYVTGGFSGTLDFDFSTSNSYPLTSRGGRDIFVTKMDANNKFIWAYQMGGANANSEDGVSVFVDNSFNVFTTGAYRSVADFSLIPGAPVTMTTTSLNTVGFLHKVSQRFCTATSSSLVLTACDSIRVNGQKYTTGGAYIQTLVNSAGCDSTISLTLTINRSVTGSNITHTTCDSFVFGNVTYKVTGVFPHKLNTAAGCDSIVMLNLTINQSVHTMLTEQACASYTIDTATYTETGVYDYRFQTSTGCDSLVTLDLTILNTRDTVAETACFRFTSSTGTYTRSGFYPETFQNAAGCDSVVVIDLTIDSVNNSVTRSGLTLSANAAGAVYQWIDCDSPANVLLNATQQTFFPVHNGSYAVVVTLGDCTDTSTCYTITGIDDDNSVDVLTINGFKAYPNPIRQQLNITVSGILQQASFRLTGITGQVYVESDNLSGNQFRFDINGLASGLYIAELREGTRIARVKITKE